MSMTDRTTERLWPARLRWRLRGAWQWPAFALAIVVDAVLLSVLPIAGDGGGVVGAVLLAAFFNLGVVAGLAPLAGRLVRRRWPGLPLIVAQDRAGTALIVALAIALAGIGLAHRPAVVDARNDFRAQARAAQRYLQTRAPPEYRLGLDRLNTWKQAPDLFRTCAPGPDPRRWLCLIVRTDRSPPSVVVDRDQEPNSRLAGPDNPGRRAP
jgi:hypothetical protein